MGGKMDYQTFQDEIKKLAEESFRENGEYALSWYTAHKNNVTKKGLTIKEKGRGLGITVYLDQYYQYYQNYLRGESLSEICSDLLSLCRENQIPDIHTSGLKDYGKMKGTLRTHLVGREQNAAFLEKGPYKIHPIGAEVVYAELARNRNGTCGMRVTHEILEQWGVPEQEVFEAARENSQKEEGVRFVSLQSLINETLLETMGEIPGLEMPEEEPPDKDGMYVLTNRFRSNGAAVLLYPGVLEEVHEKMGGDYYILPSSVHEVMILSKETKFPPEELRGMVRSINREQVLPEERLGNDVYEFQGKTGTLQKCKIAEKERNR